LTLIGLFVAGLAKTNSDCEFAKADCAPYPCGDGGVTLIDFVQALRYSAQLDPVVTNSNCGTPLAPLLLQAKAAKAAKSPTSRTLIVSNMVVAHGQTGCLPIALDAQGNENGVAWSLSFDPNLLTLVSATLFD